MRSSYIYIYIYIYREREREREREKVNVENIFVNIQNIKLLRLIGIRALSSDVIGVFTQPLRHREDATQGQFLSRVRLVWIQSFSSRQTVVPKLKSSVRPTIYPKLGEDRRDGFMTFPMILARCEIASSRFEIGSPIKFSIITSPLCVCVYIYIYIYI